MRNDSREPGQWDHQKAATPAGQEKRCGPLTKEEVNLFLDACSTHSPEHYPFCIRCAFRTGVRLGELLGLQWGDVDWHGKFIRVPRSCKLGRLTPTKTGKVRRVDMSDQLLESLKALQVERKREALKSGVGEVFETIFHRGGKHREQNYILRVFKRLLARWACGKSVFMTFATPLPVCS